MTPEEMTYLAVLLFSIPVGFAFNGRGPRTRQWGGAAIGVVLTLLTCGPHALHSLVTSLVTWALVRLLPRRCGGAALAWTFGYLLFFRTLWVWGWPQPPPYANALQLLLTLKMVSLASDVQERWEAEPAGVTSSERDELMGSIPPRPSLGETLCYSYCYLGLLTGPFYRMGTHRDWVLGAAPPGSWRVVLRRLRWVPLWGLTGELAGRLFPGGLRDPRLWRWGFPRRLFAMAPAFLALRARFYVGWGCAEGACMAAGLGGSPPEGRPAPGCGVTRPCPRHGGPPIPPELWDFAAIRTCSPRDTERAPGVGAGLRGWNRTVQWWLVRYVHARARGFSPALRNAWTMLFSAFWHGLHPGIYLSFLSVPLWLAAEGALARLLGGVPKVRGGLARVPPALFSMRVFEYLAVGFILQDLSATLRYWGSIYFCLHLLPLLILGLDALWKPGGGHPMDMLDPGLDSASGSAAPSHEKNQEPEESVDLQEGEGPSGEDVPVAIASVPVPVPGAFADSGLQYQFRSESNGSQVTYRVVQVTEAPLDGPEGAAVSVVSTFAGTTQAVIQNPFSNGGSPGAEGGTETRFAWGGDGTVSVQTDPALAQAGGQFYVMMTPQDVLQPGTQRSIAPRGHPYSPKLEGPRVPRDERRRAQHNEVERRRRDKINNWIVQLSKIIPDCGADNSKTGASKGGILSKACDYVRELRQSNQRLQETFKEAERLQMDNELLRRQMEELKSENALLRQQLQSRGDGTENNPGQGQ